MKLNTIKEMMRAGDLREAEAALREYLKADAGSTRAKVLLGVCLHLQGDEEGASRIDRQLADGGETCAAVGKFHALKVAASCAMMVLAATAGAASDNPLEGVDLGDVPGIGEPLKPMYGISVELPVKIVFDAGGGMGTMPGKSFSVKEGASLYYTLPLCAFRKPGNLFGGWSVSSGIVEEDGQRVYPTGTRIDLSRYVPKWLMISPDGTEIDRTVVMRAIWRESMGPGDDWLLISEGGKLTADVGVEVERDLEDCFIVSSGSPVTVSVSGLPAGIKYNAQTRVFSGRPTRRGVYYATCSAKNANGYQQSATVRWIVGDASEGDYDDIGLSRHVDLDALDALRVGEPFEAVEDWHSLARSVSGLPPGLKWKAKVPCPGGTCEAFAGTPTKPGKYRITFTDAARRKTVKTVIVRDADSRYQVVAVGGASLGRGTVLGGGVKKSGTAVRLSARPARGCYFAGWYADAACTEPFQGGGNYRAANASFVFSAAASKPVYAKFVTKDEDAAIGIRVDDEWRIDTDARYDERTVEVESMTQPKVTARGLPPGVKLQGLSLVVPDMAKLKPGTSVVTLTAKNLSGATATKSMRVVVPNLRSWVFDGLEYEGAYPFTVGDYSNCCRPPFEFSFAEGWTVSASGLPAGLRLVLDRESSSAALWGTPTKAGVYTVVLTARNGRRIEKATFTVSAAPFPSACVGTYRGFIGGDLPPCEDLIADDADDLGDVSGTVSVSIASNGKIGVKVVSAGKTSSLSGYSCACTDDFVQIDLRDQRGNWCELVLDMSPGNDGRARLSGKVGTKDAEWNVSGGTAQALARAGVTDVVEKLARIGTFGALTESVHAGSGFLVCPGCEPPPSKPSLMFTVNRNGTIRSSGKIEGRSVTGSSVLQVSGTGDDAVLFADFYDYRKGKGKLAYRVKFSAEWIRAGYDTRDSVVAGGSYASDCEGCQPTIR